MKKLMCPQCGATLFYVVAPNDIKKKLYLNVSFEHEIIPFKPEYAQVQEIPIESVQCTSCSWAGPITKLKKLFFG